MKRTFTGIVVLVVVVVTFTLIPRPAHADLVSVISDTTWRAYNHTPPTGWNTDVAFDDSDLAGWTFAVGNANNNHIWYGSLKSGEAPNNAWFHHLFTLEQPVTDASGVFHLDDNGDVFLNGTQIIDDNGGGASNFNLTLDPSLFVVGQNLIAVHGIDTIAPDNSIGVNMSINTVPEPSAAVGSVMACGSFIVCRRHRHHHHHHHRHRHHHRRWHYRCVVRSRSL